MKTVLVLALGYFAYDKFVLTAGRDAALPFVNISDDASNEYF